MAPLAGMGLVQFRSNPSCNIVASGELLWSVALPSSAKSEQMGVYSSVTQRSIPVLGLRTILLSCLKVSPKSSFSHYPLALLPLVAMSNSTRHFKPMANQLFNTDWRNKAGLAG